MFFAWTTSTSTLTSVGQFLWTVRNVLLASVSLTLRRCSPHIPHTDGYRHLWLFPTKRRLFTWPGYGGLCVPPLRFTFTYVHLFSICLVFSLIGVVLIARPTFLFGDHAVYLPQSTTSPIGDLRSIAAPAERGTASQRLGAVGYAYLNQFLFAAG